ncbi:MAG: EamA family transporter [Maricaulaceae bacterium]
MKLRDFIILMICCLGWGANFVVSAWALASHPIPPFMLAATRAAFVILLMGYFLFKPLPKKFGLLLIVCALVGPVHLGFLYTGLQTASATGSSIVAQFFIPMSTILSVIFLKEKVGWVRTAAIVGAFIGVIIMIYDRSNLSLDFGLVYVLLAYLALAVASIVMKFVGDIAWQQYVVWMAIVVLICMGAASLMFEQGQSEVWQTSRVPLLIAAIYAAIGVTIIAHGQYFDLIKKYDVSVVVPLTLMIPVFATVLGVIFLKDELHMRYLFGALLILPCVYVISTRGATAPTQED